MDKDGIKRQKKFDLLSLVIIFACVGILFSIVAVTFKRFPDMAITKAFTNINLAAEVIFLIGLLFAVPAVIYLLYYIGTILFAKETSDKEQYTEEYFDEPLELEPDVNADAAALPVQTAKHSGNVTESLNNAEIRNYIKAKVVKETIDARTREIEKKSAETGNTEKITDKENIKDNPQNAPLYIAKAEPENAAPAQKPTLTPLVKITDGISAAERLRQQIERKQKIENKKLLFSQSNLERYLKNYLVETASCFLMDRDKYIDYFGIAPYNKITIKPSKTAGVPDEVIYSMTATRPKLYKFCTYLIDLERFITHEQLYHNFTSSIESGKSLVRISEQLHKLYRKLYKAEFVNNFSNKEEFDNLLILVSNNYILGNNDFKNIFTRVPFEIPGGFTEDNIINYLSNPVIKEKFTEIFPNYGDVGFDSVFDAMYICFINSVKNKLSAAQIESAITTDHRRITRALVRKDRELTKQMSKKKIA